MTDEDLTAHLRMECELADSLKRLRFHTLNEDALKQIDEVLARFNELWPTSKRAARLSNTMRQEAK